MVVKTEKLSDPPFMTGFPINIGMRILAPGDIQPTPQQQAAYLRFTRMGDPHADDVVAMFRRLPPTTGRRMFETALGHGIAAVPNPPVELTTFFEQVDAVPYWVDDNKLALASRVIARTGALPWMSSLGMLALMGGYLASRVGKTLVGTGDLERMAARRLADTSAWASDVVRPGALGRFEPGFTSTIRVRLMHAMVRNGMNRRPDWNYREWDHPVNQSTLAGTLMLFGLANIVGAQALGIRFSYREREAVYHLWRYVGYLLGVDPHILPTNELDNWRLLWIQADYEFHPDADSRRLAAALVSAIGPLIAGESQNPLSRLHRWTVTGLMCGYSRLLLGKVNGDGLGLPDQKAFQAAVVALAAGRAVTEIPRQLIPGLTQAQEHLGLWCRTGMVSLMQNRISRDRTYSRHDHFATTPSPRHAQGGFA